jgi:hypothetical protein
VASAANKFKGLLKSNDTPTQAFRKQDLRTSGDFPLASIAPMTDGRSTIDVYSKSFVLLLLLLIMADDNSSCDRSRVGGATTRGAGGGDDQVRRAREAGVVGSGGRVANGARCAQRHRRQSGKEAQIVRRVEVKALQLASLLFLISFIVFFFYRLENNNRETVRRQRTTPN